MKTRRFALPLALALALVITPTLSSCFGNPIEKIVEGATGGDVDLGGKGLPDGFPKDQIPVIEGDTTGLSFGNADGKVWNVTVKVSSLDAIDTIKSQLEGAGFTANEAGIGGTSDAGATALYENDTYAVLVVVAKDGSKGFVANYTVTEKAASSQ